MRASKDALQAILRNDSDVSSAAGSYNGNPAIFTGDAPGETTHPHAIIRAPFSNEDSNEYKNKKTTPRKPMHDVAVFDKAGTSTKALDKLADAIYNALHDNISGMNDELSERKCMRIRCSGPIEEGDSKDFDGRIVTVSINLSDK